MIDPQELAALSGLAGQRSQQGVALLLAERLQQLFLADRVEVSVYGEDERPTIRVSIPVSQAETTRPDRDLLLMANQKVEGEIQIWKGRLPLPTDDSRLLTAYSTQGALALERMRMINQKTNEFIRQE